jgi:hypothetical protein
VTRRFKNGSNTKIQTVNGIRIVQAIKSYFFWIFNFGKRGFGEVEEVKMSVERHYRNDLCIYVEIDLGNLKYS